MQWQDVTIQWGIEWKRTPAYSELASRWSESIFLSSDTEKNQWITAGQQITLYQGFTLLRDICSTEHTPRLNPSKGQGCFLQCYCVLSRWISQNLHWATESFQPLPILFESLQVTHLSEVSGCTQWSLCSAGWQGEGFLLHPPVRSHHYRLQHHHLLHATTFASLDSDLEESLSPLLLVSDDGFGS